MPTILTYHNDFDIYSTLTKFFSGKKLKNVKLSLLQYSKFLKFILSCKVIECYLLFSITPSKTKLKVHHDIHENIKDQNSKSFFTILVKSREEKNLPLCTGIVKFMTI